MCLQCILDLPPPSCSLFPLLRIISTGFILPFSYMDKKYIHYIHPHSLFPRGYSFPLVPPLLPFILFIKNILIVQGGFTLVLQVGIYCALIKSTPPPLLTHSLSACSPNIQRFTIKCIMLYSHLDGLFQYF
jgi:hypothetical protein